MTGLATMFGRRRAVPQATRDAFPEGKTFLWVAAGFVLCRYLAAEWLPAIGLETLSKRYEQGADEVAPYLLLPVCLVLVTQAWQRGKLAALVIGAGSLGVWYFFFAHFKEPLAWGSLVVIGVGTAWSYLLYRSGRHLSGGPLVGAGSARTRQIIIAVAVYAAGVVVAILLRYAVNLAGNPGRLGSDLRYGVPIIPTLLVLGLYLVHQRLTATGGRPAEPASASRHGN